MQTMQAATPVLEVAHLEKVYGALGNVTRALNDVSFTVNRGEFVGIMGASGSGKSTLLNCVSTIDAATSGTIRINGQDVTRMKQAKLSQFRREELGFIFQDSNLLDTLTARENIALPLTIARTNSAEISTRVQDVAARLSISQVLDKYPYQMSGGQQQRVAAARALVTDPTMIMADEPTGALDSETSIQVMELLKDVAKDRLVVMVTHNPELAEQYANRIVRLRDGAITDDTRPFEPDDTKLAPPIHKNMGRSSMSWLTSLALSFNNLRTKKARTLLTAFAGSIGIIGIALIISLSTGVNAYIADMERSTLSEYPLQIMSSGMDFTSMLSSRVPSDSSQSTTPEEDMVPVRQLLSQMVSGITTNDLKSLKQYLETTDTTVADNATAVEYAYNVSPQIYRQDPDGSIRQVNPDSSLSSLGISSETSSNNIMSSMMNTSVFSELPQTPELYASQYDVKAGRWPEAYNECVLVLDATGSVTDYALYALGMRDNAELDKMIQQFAQNQNVDVPDDFKTYSYSDFLGKQFKLINSSDRYVYDETYSLWRDKSDDTDYMKQVVANGTDLTIVGVVQPAEDSSAAMLSSGIGYTHDLTLHVIEQAKSSAIVQQQMAAPQINVFTGEEFGADNSTSFDMSSMFSVDTDTLKNAFQFDTSALKFDLSGAFDLSSGSFDLSSLLDPDNFSLDLGDLPQPDMDMSSVFENMDLSISPEALQNMMQKILNGYKDYVVGNGILNLDKISFSAYMQTEQFQQLLASSMSELLADANLQEQFSAAMQTVMESYSAQISQALQSQLSTAMNTAMQQMGTRISQQMESAIQKNIAQLGSQMENALKIDASAFQNAIHMNMTQEELAELMKSSMLSSTSTYDGNLQSLGYADLDDPSTISIYPKDFDCKALIVDALDAYNASAEANGEDDKVVRYTDVVGTLMTSVTKIINMISNMLVAFVSISLVVSSIMIGVITYISVLERRKEIGILRAIGASKRNISEVFNAETFIIGLCSGCMGVGLSLILLIPGNMLIHSIADSASVTAALPLQAALVLIALATLLTILGGLIPAKSASKCDPVKALRSE